MRDGDVGCHGLPRPIDLVYPSTLAVRVMGDHAACDRRDALQVHHDRVRRGSRPCETAGTIEPDAIQHAHRLATR